MTNLKSEIKHDAFAVKFTAEEQGKLLAWGYLYVIFQDRHKEPYALMENIYVEQEYRNRGIGRQLVEAMIDRAKREGCYKIIGTSKLGNESAHRFYERFGLKKIGYEFRMDLKESKPLTRD